LTAAARVFAQHGYSAADLDQVGRKAGVAKSTIYLYFRSKEALFLATVDDAMRQLTAAIDTVRDSVTDPLEVIDRAIRVYLEFFDRNPHYVELLIQERAQFKDRKTPTYFEHQDANLGPWRDLLRSLIGQKRVRDVPVDRIVNVVGELVYGTMFTNYFAGRRRSVAQQHQEIVDIVWHGILSDQERSVQRKRRKKNS
jgi:AcrR family transcriptional regulator